MKQQAIDAILKLLDEGNSSKIKTIKVLSKTILFAMLIGMLGYSLIKILIDNKGGKRVSP